MDNIIKAMDNIKEMDNIKADKDDLCSNQNLIFSCEFIFIVRAVVLNNLWLNIA